MNNDIVPYFYKVTCRLYVLNSFMLEVPLILICEFVHVCKYIFLKEDFQSFTLLREYFC